MIRFIARRLVGLIAVLFAISVMVFLLFNVIPGGDPSQMAARLRQLLQDPDLRRKMGAASYQRVQDELNETVYRQRFTRMVEDTVQGQP